MPPSLWSWWPLSLPIAPLITHVHTHNMHTRMHMRPMSTMHRHANMYTTHAYPWMHMHVREHTHICTWWYIPWWTACHSISITPLHWAYPAAGLQGWKHISQTRFQLELEFWVWRRFSQLETLALSLKCGNEFLQTIFVFSCGHFQCVGIRFRGVSGRTSSASAGGALDCGRVWLCSGSLLLVASAKVMRVWNEVQLPW